MDITINCREVKVSANNYKVVSVDLEDVDIDEVIEQFDLDAVINSIGIDRILDHLGVDAAVDHFGLDQE